MTHLWLSFNIQDRAINIYPRNWGFLVDNWGPVARDPSLKHPMTVETSLASLKGDGEKIS